MLVRTYLSLLWTNIAQLELILKPYSYNGDISINKVVSRLIARTPCILEN
jgi:hypothetical protein